MSTLDTLLIVAALTAALWWAVPMSWMRRIWHFIVDRPLA
jgi:hypothetical protein